MLHVKCMLLLVQQSSSRMQAAAVVHSHAQPQAARGPTLQARNVIITTQLCLNISN